jgi:hypothetical protein
MSFDWILSREDLNAREKDALDSEHYGHASKRTAVRLGMCMLATCLHSSACAWCAHVSVRMCACMCACHGTRMRAPQVTRDELECVRVPAGVCAYVRACVRCKNQVCAGAFKALKTPHT